jgi:hypothetical protein
MENGYLEETLERLAAATVQLERTIAGMEERHVHVCGDVEKIIATADGQQEATRMELERKLAEAEQKIAVLQAQSEANALGGVRRTMPAGPAQMIAKSSVHATNGVEAGVLDAALNGLSLEQRIAVKSQLARAGLLGQ